VRRRTIAQLLIELHEEVVFLVDVELLVGQLVVNDVVAHPLLQVVAQLVVLADLICILDVVLELLLHLPHRCQRVPYLTHDVAV
jgi:hypothetical protein